MAEAENKTEIETKPKVEDKPEVKVETKPEAETKPEVETKAETKPETKAPPDPDWKEERLAKVTGQKHALEAQLRSAQTELAALKAGKPAANDAEFEARVAREAEARAAQKIFDDACEVVTREGRAAFPDFDTKVNELLKITDRSDKGSLDRYAAFVAAMIDTGRPVELIADLSSDLNRASRIFNLPPTKQAVELTKLALAKVEPVSQAKKPITPLGRQNANTKGDIDPTDIEKAGELTTREWMARRQAQVDERAKRRA
jgi:hypothetical protein